MKDYHVNLFWSEDDACYVGDIPDLENCSAFGDTLQEALEELIIARDLWLDVARERGWTIPEPSYRPAIYFAVGSWSPSAPDTSPVR